MRRYSQAMRRSSVRVERATLRSMDRRGGGTGRSGG